MSLPRILSPDTITIPPREELSFPDSHLSGMQGSFPVGGEWQLAITFLPYNYETGESGPSSEVVRAELHNLRTLAEQRALAGKPALANALGAVLLAAVEIRGEMPSGESIVEFKPSEETGD